MVYRVRLSDAARSDLELIFDFLVETYEALGERPDEALDRAATRLRGIRERMETLGASPHQGTLWPDLMPGLRWATKDRAIYYFLVDESEERLDVLAVFFGGQDHKARALLRLKNEI